MVDISHLKPYQFQPGQKAAAKNLSETQIRYAMDNSLSNAGAARWLHVTERTYKKYASLYFDENGVSLYQLHMNRYAAGIKKQKLKRWTSKHHRDTLREVLDGTAPNRRQPSKLLEKLIKAEYFLEECSICGFNERRVLDAKVPLYLDFIDGNRKNGKIENLQVLCHNHFFLLSGNKRGKQPEVPLGYGFDLRNL